MTDVDDESAVVFVASTMAVVMIAAAEVDVAAEKEYFARQQNIKTIIFTIRINTNFFDDTTSSVTSTKTFRTRFPSVLN